MIFINNKYTNIYYKIIDRARSRDLSSDTYTENHHIIPRSLGGDNSKNNLVKLTAREHYICHLLLAKMTVKESKYKMLCAILRMAKSSQPQRVKMHSRKYEYIKKQKAKMHSEMFSGKNNPFYNKTHSEETKEKLREARSRQVKNQGGTMTAVARKKLSEAAKGRVLSTEHKEKIGKGNKGKRRSDEYKRQISLRMTGRVKLKETLDKLREKASRDPKPQVICPHCGKIGGEPSMKRWHMDNCRNK